MFVNVIMETKCQLPLKCTINVIRNKIMKFTYTLTTDEDQVLLDMIQFFDDMGLPDSFDSKAFDSLSNKFFKNVQEIIMTITRSDCRYYIKEIKDLAKNFDDKIEQQINDKAKSITASKLKELYDELMDYVYGDGGIKGY